LRKRGCSIVSIRILENNPFCSYVK
jgi:hypothetical protein